MDNSCTNTINVRELLSSAGDKFACGDFECAKKEFNEVLSVALDNPALCKYAAISYTGLAEIYASEENKPASIDNYKKALAVFERAGDNINISYAKCLFGLGYTYFKDGNIDGAKKLFSRIHCNEESSREMSGQDMVELMLIQAKIYHVFGNISDELNILNEAEKLAQKIVSNEYEARVLMCKGEAYMDNASTASARDAFEKALKFYSEDDVYKLDQAKCYDKIGNIDADNRHYKEAILELNTAKRLFGEFVEEDESCKGVFLHIIARLGNIYYMNKDYADAVNCYTEYKEIIAGDEDYSSEVEEYRLKIADANYMKNGGKPVESNGEIFGEVPKARKCYLRAKEYDKSREYEKALKAYNKSIKKSSKGSDNAIDKMACYLAMAVDYLELNHEDEVVRISKEVLDMQYSTAANIYFAKANHMLADCYKKDKDYDSAIENYVSAALYYIESKGKENIQVATCYREISYLYIEVGKYRDAFKNFPTLIDIINKLGEEITVEERIDTYFKAANVAFNVAEYLSSKEWFEKVIRLIDTNHVCEYRRSSCYEYLAKINAIIGNTEDALMYYDKFFSIYNEAVDDPYQDRITTAYVNIGDIYAMKNDAKNAAKYFSLAMNKYNGNNLLVNAKYYMWTGTDDYNNGEYSKSKLELSNAININEELDNTDRIDLTDTFRMLAYSCLTSGDIEDATKYYAEYEKRCTNNKYSINYGIAKDYYNNGYYTNAYKYIERAESFRVGNDELSKVKFEREKLKIQVLLKMNKFEEAKSLAESLLERIRMDLHEAIDYDILGIRVLLGDAYLGNKEYNMAGAMYSEVYRAMIDGAGEPIDYNIGNIVSKIALVDEKLGVFNKAVEVYNALIETTISSNDANRDKELVTYLFMLARTYYKAGEYDNAIKVLRKMVSLSGKVYGTVHRMTALAYVAFSEVHKVVDEFKKNNNRYGEVAKHICRELDISYSELAMQLD